jgi:hypothetical protein
MLERFNLSEALTKTKAYKQAHANLNGKKTTLQKQPAPKPKLPEIRITTDMTAVVDATEKAIKALPGAPLVFQRARQLCLISHRCPPPKWLDRPPDAPVIVQAGPAALRELASRAARWLKYDKRADRWEPALPPEWGINTLIERPGWSFPPLEEIVCSPTLRPDGSLLTRPGYDKSTGLFLDTTGTRFPEIRAEPTLDEARIALDVLKEPFVDFPFARPCHQSATLAAVCSLIARPAIRGNVPLFPVRAHTPATGKGLLVNTIATITTGRIAPCWPQVMDEEEERKRLLTIGLSGAVCAHIDNVTQPFGSAPLDAVLTAGALTDRLLRTNEYSEVPIRTVFFASGNNLIFKGDTARRAVPIDLDSKVEKPEERTGFTHARLLDYTRANRPALVAAALTVLRAYFVAGCPRQGLSEYGSFEAWSDLIRHALVWAGEPDPCEGRAHIVAESDTGHEALATLLHCWFKCYETRAVTLKTIFQDIECRAVKDVAELTPSNDWNALAEALSAYDERSDGRRLDARRIGNGLRKIEGRVLENRRLTTAGKAHGTVKKWCIESL